MDAPGAPGTGLDGLVAVVTGGSRGIGFGIARALGRAGMAVSLWARDAGVGEAAAAELSAEGTEALFVECDVTDESAVERATARTLEALGRIDAAVANAGGARHDDFLDMTLARFERQLRLNLTSAFLTFRETARAMVSGGHAGALVAVSSCAALHASPLMPAYAAAKAGLGGLVRSVAAELAPHRIRANVLMAGWTTNSAMSTSTVPAGLAVDTLSSIPVGRWGTPDDLGRAALFLCDPSFSFHTGTELRVDGGYSVTAPYLAVRAARHSLRAKEEAGAVPAAGGAGTAGSPA
jgi:NAD(P)-dependent dehydrogenase (short-subunit alcohol dehydrogenase family)